MAIDPNALTLSEYAMMSNDPLVTKITFSLHEAANILQDVPLVSKKTMVQNGVHWVDNLPQVTWGELNVAPAVTKGKPTPMQEQAYIIRNQFQIDRKLMEDVNQIQDPLDVQVNAWMKSFTYEFNYRFINNAHDGSTNSNTLAPAGVRFRLDNPVRYQLISEMKMDAGGVDLSVAGLNQQTANEFIELVQQVLDFMGAPDGDGVTLYMNDYLKRRFERAVRLLGAGGGFAMTKDAFDRPISMYKGAKIRDVGRRADQITRIILPNETNTGLDTGGPPIVNGQLGSGSFTSLYGVRYGSDYALGWQYEPLKPQNMGLDPTNGVTYNTVIDWAVGLWIPNNRAVARLFDIKLA